MALPRHSSVFSDIKSFNPHLKPCEVVSLSLLRDRETEVKKRSQGHTNSKRRSSDSNMGALAPESVCVVITLLCIPPPPPFRGVCVCLGG